MKLIKIFIIFIIFSPIYASGSSEELNNLYKNIRCLTCQAQSIYDSDSEFSIKMREWIIKEHEQGKSIEEIKKHIEQEWGEEIFFNAKTKNLLYVAPLVVIFFGFLFIMLRVKR